MKASVGGAATGVEIHPGVQIGTAFFIDHGTSAVIGETAVIGERVRVYQAVTRGAKRFPRDAAGNLEKGLAHHAIVEDNVVIYAGATILGRVTLGRGTVIGGNVWLTESVPPFSHLNWSRILAGGAMSHGSMRMARAIALRRPRGPLAFLSTVPGIKSSGHGQRRPTGNRRRQPHGTAYVRASSS